MVASGGVSSLDDLRVLAVLVPGGVEGAIVVVQVAALIDPRMLIEVEAVAWSGVPPEHSAFG